MLVKNYIIIVYSQFIAIIILTVVFLAAEVLCHYYYCYLLLCVNKKELLSFVPSADFDRKSRAIYLLFR